MLRGFIVGDQILQPFFQPAHAGAGATFGSPDPAPQLGHLAARQAGGEAAIGGIEQMMAFVEDIAQAAAFFDVGVSVVSSSPSQSALACAITSAWLATTMLAWRARRMARWMKQMR